MSVLFSEKDNLRRDMTVFSSNYILTTVSVFSENAEIQRRKAAEKKLKTVAVKGRSLELTGHVRI